jgi:type III secretion protein O
MAYILEDLLRVRKFREDAAAAELTRCRKLVAEAEEQVELRKRELQEYVQWRLKREEEMYREVMQKPIHLNDLEDLKVSIQILRDDELKYEERIITAEKQLNEARQELEQAQAAYRQAVKDREKLEEHKEMWLEEEQKLQEAQAEKEIEDIPFKSGALTLE